MKNTNKLIVLLFCLGLFAQVFAEDDLDKL